MGQFLQYVFSIQTKQSIDSLSDSDHQATDGFILDILLVIFVNIGQEVSEKRQGLGVSFGLLDVNDGLSEFLRNDMVREWQRDESERDSVLNVRAQGIPHLLDGLVKICWTVTLGIIDEIDFELSIGVADGDSDISLDNGDVLSCQGNWQYKGKDNKFGHLVRKVKW